MFSFPLINQFAIALSLFTTTGIALHDTKVDKAFISTIQTASVAKSDSSPTSSLMKSNELHTHVERMSIAKSIHEMQGNTPRIHARDDIKKHVTPKAVSRGHHAFDNYNLPLV